MLARIPPVVTYPNASSVTITITNSPGTASHVSDTRATARYCALV